jgi:hypothetical protein
VTLDEVKQLFDAQKPHFSAWIAVHDSDIDEPRVSLTTGLGHLRVTLLYYYVGDLYDRAEHLDVRPENKNVKGGQYVRAIHAALYMAHLSRGNKSTCGLRRGCLSACGTTRAQLYCTIVRRAMGPPV